MPKIAHLQASSRLHAHAKHTLTDDEPAASMDKETPSHGG